MTQLNPHANRHTLSGSSPALTKLNPSSVEVCSVDHPTAQKTERVFKDSFQMRGSSRDGMINERMFAHIHGDGLIGETPLECHVFHEVMDYSEGELNRLEAGHYQIETSDSEKGVIREMHTEMRECTHLQKHLSTLGLPLPKEQQNHQLLQELGRELAQSVAEMSPGSRKLIPGGWVGRPGHAMLYEVVKVSPDQYEFHVINTGDGVSKYHPTREIDGNLEVQCSLEYGGLSSKELNSAFFTDLMAMKVGPLWDDSKYPSGAKHLYEQVLPMLERGRGHIVKPSPTHPSWMKPQMSGICTWQCIKAWEKSRLHPKTYEHLQLCTKVRTFNEFCSINQVRLSRESFMSHLVEYVSSELGQELARFTEGRVCQVPELDLSQMKKSQVVYVPDEDSAVLWSQGSAKRRIVPIKSLLADRLPEDKHEMSELQKLFNQAIDRVYSKGYESWSSSIDTEKHKSKKRSWSLSTPSWLKNFIAMVQQLITASHSTSKKKKGSSDQK